MSVSVKSYGRDMLAWILIPSRHGLEKEAEEARTGKYALLKNLHYNTSIDNDDELPNKLLN